MWIWLTSFVLPTLLLQLLTKLQILTRYCIHSPTHGDTGGTVGAASEASAAFAHRPDLGDHLEWSKLQHWTLHIYSVDIYYLYIYTLIQNLGLVDGLHLDLVAGALGRDGPAPGICPQLTKIQNIKIFYISFKNIYMPQKIFHLVGLLGLHLDWDCVPEHENCDVSVADREDISEVSKDWEERTWGTCQLAAERWCSRCQWENHFRCNHTNTLLGKRQSW